MMTLGRRAVGLCAAIALALTGGGCGTVVREMRKDATGMVSPPPSDLARAKAAWSYFETTDVEGVSEAIAGAGFTTPTALGDEIAALISAWRMGLIARSTFDSRIILVLRFLESAQLSGGVLPGRYYDIHSGQLLNPPAKDGDPGWSSVDLGRLLIWLRILAEEQPKRAAMVDEIVSRWRLCAAIDDHGRPLLAFPADGRLITAIDAGTGYRDYAVQGLRAWGVQTRPASPDPLDFTIKLEGLNMPLPLGGQAEPLMSPPLALIGMEFGWKTPDGAPMTEDRRLFDLAFDAQNRRFERTRTLTARGDYRRRSAPYAVVDSVMAAGYPWSTTDASGAPRADLALLSTRAAFGLHVLHPNSGYGRRLIRAVDGLRGSGGWIEGRYERGAEGEDTKTAATNAFVLEALLYEQAGPLFPTGNGADRPASTSHRARISGCAATAPVGGAHP
jgi:hypothetical protein